MPPTEHSYKTCPACGAKKAVGRSALFGLSNSNDEREDMISLGVRHCLKCGAKNIRGVVVRAGDRDGISIRTSPEAARAVAEAIARETEQMRSRARGLLRDADEADDLAARILSLHE